MGHEQESRKKLRMFLSSTGLDVAPYSGSDLLHKIIPIRSLELLECVEVPKMPFRFHLALQSCHTIILMTLFLQ